MVLEGEELVRSDLGGIPLSRAARGSAALCILIIWERALPPMNALISSVRVMSTDAESLRPADVDLLLIECRRLKEAVESAQCEDHRAPLLALSAELMGVLLLHCDASALGKLRMTARYFDAGMKASRAAWDIAHRKFGSLLPLFEELQSIDRLELLYLLESARALADGGAGAGGKFCCEGSRELSRGYESSPFRVIPAVAFSPELLVEDIDSLIAPDYEPGNFMCSHQNLLLGSLATWAGRSFKDTLRTDELVRLSFLLAILVESAKKHGLAVTAAASRVITHLVKPYMQTRLAWWTLGGAPNTSHTLHALRYAAELLMENSLDAMRESTPLSDLLLPPADHLQSMAVFKSMANVVFGLNAYVKQDLTEAAEMAIECRHLRLCFGSLHRALGTKDLKLITCISRGIHMSLALPYLPFLDDAGYPAEIAQVLREAGAAELLARRLILACDMHPSDLMQTSMNSPGEYWLTSSRSSALLLNALIESNAVSCANSLLRDAALRMVDTCLSLPPAWWASDDIQMLLEAVCQVVHEMSGYDTNNEGRGASLLAAVLRRGADRYDTRKVTLGALLQIVKSGEPGARAVRSIAGLTRLVEQALAAHEALKQDEDWGDWLDDDDYMSVETSGRELLAGLE